MLSFYYSNIITAQREIPELRYLINRWSEITCLDQAENTKKNGDFKLMESFTPFHRQVHKALRGIAV